jgi:hypothetical protein
MTLAIPAFKKIRTLKCQYTHTNCQQFQITHSLTEQVDMQHGYISHDGHARDSEELILEHYALQRTVPCH